MDQNAVDVRFDGAGSRSIEIGFGLSQSALARLALSGGDHAGLPLQHENTVDVRLEVSALAGMLLLGRFPRESGRAQAGSPSGVL